MRVICSDCAHQVPIGTTGRCPACAGILRPDYADDVVSSLKNIQPGRGIDRYRALMPVTTAIPTLGEGDTPLIASKRLGASLGLSELYFKNEGLNPTGAFKDRAGAMAAALALDVGATGVLSASSGNASSSIAAYCAAAGLPCVILMEPGNPAAKMRQTLATGARVVLVDGIFAHGPDDLFELLNAVATQIGYYLAFIWAPVNPYVLEGIKTISYEIAARITPDVVIAPVGGGDMFTAQWRGYLELKRAGIIDKTPRMIGAQSTDAPPLVKAFQNEDEKVVTLPYANSKVSGINVPFTGDHALAAIRESGGRAVAVPDEEIFAMQGRIATEEGIWIEPAGAASTAALSQLLSEGHIAPDEKIVCVMSGAGFKDATLAASIADDLRARPPVPFDAAKIAGAALR